MNIFFPKEPESETRVSLTLETAKKFLDKGLNISIEKSFAEHLGSSDKEFEDLGVKTLNRDEGFASSEIVCSVRNLTENELSKICLLYTSPSPRDMRRSRMPSSA